MFKKEKKIMKVGCMKDKKQLHKTLNSNADQMFEQ